MDVLRRPRWRRWRTPRWIRVEATGTQAALVGHTAVADVIHLIAELVENATLFSPPNTPVRLTGDVVGRGFAVEIEDRGLGLSDERLAELNELLDHPPAFDLPAATSSACSWPASAGRHDIKISLRPSPYGGTTAIVLIPLSLVVPGRASGSSAATHGRPAGAAHRPPRGPEDVGFAGWPQAMVRLPRPARPPGGGGDTGADVDRLPNTPPNGFRPAGGGNDPWPRARTAAMPRPVGELRGRRRHAEARHHGPAGRAGEPGRGH